MGGLGGGDTMGGGGVGGYRHGTRNHTYIYIYIYVCVCVRIHVIGLNDMYASD